MAMHIVIVYMIRHLFVLQLFTTGGEKLLILKGRGGSFELAPKQTDHASADCFLKADTNKSQTKIKTKIYAILGDYIFKKNIVYLLTIHSYNR